MMDFSDPQFRWERAHMVALQLRARGISDERVLAAMERTPRHLFVDEGSQSRAYQDHPLPIGMDQTISQPYIVAVMLEALRLKAEDRVLEIGTGSGYVTALLCQLVKYTYSVERHQPLAELAERRLKILDFDNARIVVGDGARGLSDFAPYDVVLVSAAANSFPTTLFSQLREGGRMIAPIGPPDTQELQLITKREGTPSICHLDPCRFVPLISDATEGPER